MIRSILQSLKGHAMRGAGYLKHTLLTGAAFLAGLFAPDRPVASRRATYPQRRTTDSL